MIPIDGDIMRNIAPRLTGTAAQRQDHIIAEIAPVLQPTLERYEIKTRLRIAYFLAQTCHESGGFRTTEEFASGDQYEGRADLGNTERGDGRRYKGRGLLQLTGRTNYREYGRALDVDLEGAPALAAEPVLALRIACEYWKRRNLNADADHDDLVGATRTTTGGLNGLADRRALLAKAKGELARLEALAVEPGGHAVLQRGSAGEGVAKLQTMLRKLGFELSIDQDFGPATELAVTQFQRDNDLEADGIVGQITWDALQKTAG